MKDSNTCIIAAGGTGGHIYPALAVAHKLHNKSHRIIWLGVKTPVEEKILDGVPWQYDAIKAAPFRGKAWREKVWAIFGALTSLWTCVKYVIRFKPRLVLVTGGYVSFGMGLAARLLRVPLFVCEQNARAGTVNKLLSYIATRVFTAYPGVFPHLKKNVVIECGNPIREEIQAYAKKRTEQKTFSVEGVFTIMVMGGSQGAAVFNEYLPGILAKLTDKHTVRVFHQSGKGKKRPEDIEKAYTRAGIKAEVHEYFDNITTFYQKSHLVICRAGASTVSELVSLALPSILVPLPSAIDDHQTANARHVTKVGAAWLLPEKDLISGNHCINYITVLRNHQGQYQMMCQAGQSIAKKQAAGIMLDKCEGVLQGLEIM